jgi:thiamine biosynthesis lipoprotein
MSQETAARFACFGGTCAAYVSGDACGRSAAEAVARTRSRLLDWHRAFTRFEPGSELSRLNADPRSEVPVSPTMAAFVASALDAAERTGGLVDATLLGRLEAAGYRGQLGTPLPLRVALRLAPARRPGAPHPEPHWRSVALDPVAGTVRRPPGVQLDSGGLAKGLFADLLADELGAHASFAVDCAGDLRLGGAPRAVHVASPFERRTLHTLEPAGGGVATSGIGKRSWLDPRGRPAHHLLDPATGAPAFTGVVQVTALAPTALEAEVLAKAALLSGPAAAAGWLSHGGVVVLDDGAHRVVEAA